MSPDRTASRRLSGGVRVALVGVAVCAALVILGLGALHLPSVRQWVLGEIAARLDAQRIGFSAGKLHYNLWSLTASVDHATVRGLDAPDLEAFATVERATLSLSLLDFLRGRYVVDYGRAEGVDVHYVVAADGRTNLPMPSRTPGKEPGGGLDYLLADLRVQQARVRYEDRGRGIDVELPIEAATVRGEAATGRHHIRLTAAAGRAQVGDRQATIDGVSADVDLGRDDLSLDQLDVSAAGADLHVSGGVASLSNPILNLDIQGDIDLEPAVRAVGLAEPIGGHLRVQVSARGPIDELEVRTRADGDDVQVKGLAPAAVSVDASYDRATHIASIPAFSVSAPWGNVTVRGRVAAEAPADTQVFVRAANLDAQALMHAFRLPYVAASHVDAEAAATLPGLSYRQASGKASATLTPYDHGLGDGVVPVGGVISATARDGVLRASVARARVLATDLTARLAIGRAGALEGEIRARIDAVERTIKASEAFLGRRPGSFTKMPVRGSVTAQARLGGTTRAPVARARLNAPDLDVGELNGVAVAADTNVTPSDVLIHDLHVQWQEATAAARGQLTLAAPRPMALTLTASGLDLAAVQAALDASDPNGTHLEGRLSAEAFVGGTLDHPQARLQLLGTDLSAYGEPLGHLTADASLSDRLVRLSAFTLDKPQQAGEGRLSLGGDYHLGTGAYTFALDSENLQLESLALPGAAPVRGAIEVSGEGRGTVDDPEATMRVSARDVSIAAREVGTVTATLSVADRLATVEADAARFAATVHGEAGIRAPYPGRLRLDLDDLAVEALPLDLKTPLSGRVRARVEAEGSGAHLDQATVNATIESADLSWNGQPVSLDGPAVGHYANRVVTVDRLDIEAGNSTLSARGQIPLDSAAAPGQIDLDARLQLGTLAAYAPAGIDASAEGTLLVNGRLTGTMAAVDPELTMALDNGLLLAPELGTPVTDVHLRALVASGEATIESLSASWGTARLEASAHVPLAALVTRSIGVPASTADSVLDARISGFNPALVPGAPEGFGGHIDVSAHASAPGGDLAAAKGRVQFDELGVAYQGLTLAQPAPSAITLSDGVATIEQIALSGSMGEVEATGTVRLADERSLGLLARGKLDIAAISAFTDRLRAEGPATFELRADGRLDAPHVGGRVELANAMLSVDDPSVTAEGLRATVTLEDSRLTLSALSGVVNGGTLEGSGYVVLGDDIVEDANVRLSVEDLAFAAPLDLRTLSDVTLQISPKENALVVDGQVRIHEGGLTGDVNFDTGLLGALATPRGLDLTEERQPLLERIRFNVGVATESPILVDNNIAQAEVTAGLRVLGTPYDVGLSGNLELAPGSTVTLNERRYDVDRGVIAFTDETRIAPFFDLRLTTSARNYDITVGVSGEVGETESTLASDPALPEPDILALLVAGRTLEEMRGEEYDVAREQVLSYLTGRVGSRVGRAIERVTGLSEVRVEPNLIANEVDPGARLTVGQDLVDGLRLVHSTDLGDSSNQLWVAEFDITRHFQTRMVRQPDNAYRFDFRHDVRLGGEPEPRRVPRTRPPITRVTFLTDAALTESQLLELLGVNVGEPYDFFAVREGIERIEATLREAGFLQSRVRMERRVSDVDYLAELTLEVSRGPKVELSFTGMVPPRGVQDQVAEQWHRGVFDSQRGGDAVDVLRLWLIGERHMNPSVEYRVDDLSPDARRVVFDINPGPRFDRITLAFDGARQIPPEVLRRIVEQQDLETDLFTDPFVVTELLRRYYREEGYLAAAVDRPVLEFSATEARIVLRVTEGPRFVVNSLSVSGNGAVPTPTLVAGASLRIGDPFLPVAARSTLDRLRDMYWSLGYSDVKLRYEVDANRETGATGVSVIVDEGHRSVVTAVEVSGTDRTSEALIRSEIEVKPGSVLDVAALGRARRNLYRTGAYSAVEMTRAVAESPTAGSDGVSSDATPDRAVTVNALVREVQPYQLSYGGSYDTERGAGGLFELANHNSLGRARVLGTSTRYDSQLREARVYFSQPTLRRVPLKTTATVFYREERNPLTDLSQAFNIDRLGASLQVERQLSNQYVWNVSYRYEQARTFDPRPGAGLDETSTVTPLTSTFTRDTRDEIMDATRGALTSHAVSYSPAWLGSDVAYIKYYGQYSVYLPLQPPGREPLTNEIVRPRWVFASSLRLGLSHAAGGELPTSERFFAGGSTTLRGFAQNSIGPIGAAGIPIGGSGTVILNNELRFPLTGRIDGVGFLDIGGVFSDREDPSWRAIRESAGVGLRLRTPWFLLRGDYGFVLDRRAGERRGRFFFSVGQAF